MAVELLSGRAGQVGYHDGAGLDPLLSPRPFLTVTTAAGVAVTEVGPEDHLHHLGVSVALPDVNGTTFWGGRTFVRGEGSRMLGNHGRQIVLSRERGPNELVERLRWLDGAGEPLLDEAREIVVREEDEGPVVLWTSRLTAAHRPVSFGSPQTNGRDGAFYGGIFWRAPFGTARVRSAAGEGTDAAHGSTSPWLALDGPAASLVAVTASGMPWFVRAEGYVGFCPAVAVDGRRELAEGDTLSLDLAVAVLGRPPEAPEAIAARLQRGASVR